MNRITIFIFLSFLLVTAMANAQQSYVVTPNKSVQMEVPLNKNVTILDIYQENTDTVPISLAWRKLELSLPPEWDYSMCELGRCYAGIPDSSQMDDVPPHEKAFLGVNIIPNHTAGTGTVRCVVFDVRHPDHRDTLTWFVTASAAAVLEKSQSQQFVVIPNPSTGLMRVNFHKDFSGSVTVFDSKGKQVRSETVRGISVNVDLSTEPAGTYVLVARNTTGDATIRNIVKK